MKTSQSLSRDDADQRIDKYPALGETCFSFHLKRESKRPVRSRTPGVVEAGGEKPPAIRLDFLNRILQDIRKYLQTIIKNRLKYIYLFPQILHNGNKDHLDHTNIQQLFFLGL